MQSGSGSRRTSVARRTGSVGGPTFPSGSGGRCARTTPSTEAPPDDILVRITVANRGPVSAPIHVLPTLWFRNTWSWGRQGEGHTACPRISRSGPAAIVASHEQMKDMNFHLGASDRTPELLF